MNATEKIQNFFQSNLGINDIFYTDLRSDWGDENPDYRLSIRKGLFEYLKNNHPDEIADSVWDLETPPVLKSLFISISHSHGMGGFIVCTWSVGLDIENTTRISEKIVERVSSEEELKSCPEFELLWPAKEAIFKCSTEFYTISQIQIQSWQASQNETYFFTSFTTVGCAFKDSKHSYAAVIKKFKL